MDRYLNHLSIRERQKCVPYGGTAGRPRPDGSVNHGFKNLKGRPGELASIPELVADTVLRGVVEAINGSATGLFSVGCVSGPVEEERGHRRAGYVEFALNSMEGVQNAANYFPPFFHFNRLLHSEQFDRARFDWELEGAEFLAVNVAGFTCAVFVNTRFVATEAEALADWECALRLLGVLLGGIPSTAGDPIYTPPE